MIEHAKILEHISITKFNMLTKCEFQFFMRYVMGIKSPPGGALVFGRADDETKNDVYEKKIATGDTAESGYCRDKFAHQWEVEIEKANNDIDWGDEDRGKLKDIGINLASTWRQELAVHVKPVKTQHEFHVEIPYHIKATGEQFSFDFMGYLDLIEDVPIHSENGTTTKRLVTDNKTSNKKWPKNRAKGESQAMGYQVGAQKDPELVKLGVAHDEFHYHIAVKTKTPTIQHPGNDPEKTVCTSTQHDRDGFVRQLAKAHRKIADNLKTGNWMANGRNHILCSKKWCGYWKECQTEHGGFIKD